MNLLVFHDFRVSKAFIHRSGMARFSVKKFLSHSTECHRRGTFLCFRGSLYRKNLWIGGLGVGSTTIFRQNFFLSHSAEKFRRGIFQCFTDFGYGNFLWITRVGHDFLSKVYFSHSTRKLRIKNPSVFQRFSGTEKI